MYCDFLLLFELVEVLFYDIVFLVVLVLVFIEVDWFFWVVVLVCDLIGLFGDCGCDVMLV